MSKFYAEMLDDDSEEINSVDTKRVSRTLRKEQDKKPQRFSEFVGSYQKKKQPSKHVIKPSRLE